VRWLRVFFSQPDFPRLPVSELDSGLKNHEPILAAEIQQGAEKRSQDCNPQSSMPVSLSHVVPIVRQYRAAVFLF
jgi:hypothetical protein